MKTMSSLKNSYKKKCFCEINNGSVFEFELEYNMPDMIIAAMQNYKQASTDKNQEILFDLLSKHLYAYFVPGNIPTLESILLTTDDITASKIEILEILPSVPDWPIVSAKATFEINFKKDLSQEELEKWEEEHDEPISFCVSFCWMVDGKERLFLEEGMNGMRFYIAESN